MTKLEGRQCIAVGHWWEFAPTTAQDFDALLSIATIRESLELIQPGDPWRTWYENAPSTIRQYRVQLPPLRNVNADFGVSGVLGLVTPDRIQTSPERSSAFERTVADAIMWEIAAMELVTTYPIVIY